MRNTRGANARGDETRGGKEGARAKEGSAGGGGGAKREAKDGRGGAGWQAGVESDTGSGRGEGGGTGWQAGADSNTKRRRGDSKKRNGENERKGVGETNQIQITFCKFVFLCL